MDEDYLKLFKQQTEQKEDENLNETKQNPWEQVQRPQQNQWEQLHKSRQNQQWQNINETPDVSQYNVNENVNDGWGTLDVQVETRVNGVVQNNKPNNHHGTIRRKPQQADPNGLNQFIDESEDLREVVKQPQVQQQTPPPPVQSVKDVDVVSVDMFENMNSNAMLSFANERLSRVNAKNVRNNADDRQVKIIPLKS